MAPGSDARLRLGVRAGVLRRLFGRAGRLVRRWARWKAGGKARVWAAVPQLLVGVVLIVATRHWGKMGGLLCLAALKKLRVDWSSAGRARRAARADPLV